MNILIVSSNDVIFRQLAFYLSQKIKKNNNKVTLVSEITSISLLSIIKQRIKKSGLVSGISQFLFKVIDVFFLRREVSRICKKELGGIQIDSVLSLNSQVTRDYLRSNQFDIVIGIATSIIKKETLEIPKFGFVNIHPGILPEYRGTGNFWAVMNEDWGNIGCTIHWMTDKIDVGKIIAITKLESDFENLWDMNYRAIIGGINKLINIINYENINSIEESREVAPNYYGWYGIKDYFIFKKKLNKRKG